MEHRPIEQLFHPTDLSPGSTTAFLHALRIATVTRSRLTIMHVAEDDDMNWSELPGVRATLARWGLIAGAEDMDGLMRLGVGVKKVVTEGGDPAKACTEYLEKHPTDLIVLSTHQHGGRMGWLKRRVAEPLSRDAHVPTLFLPHERPGFVDPDTGAVNIRNILVPMAHDPHPRPAIRAAVRMAHQLAGGPVRITLLHVGGADAAPQPDVPTVEGITWDHQVRGGEVEESILQVAADREADLIVMTTKGHEGFLDALRGNTTERVLRQARCPVLATLS